MSAAGHRRWLVMMRTDLADRRHLGGGSGDEAFVEVAEFGRQDSPLDDLKPALASKIDDRRSCDAGKEAIGDRGMNRSVLDEEYVGAGAFRHPALPVVHQSVGIAATLGAVLGDGADHVETCGFRHRRSGRRIRPPIVGDIEPDPFHPLGGIEIARPLPHGDAQMDRVVLRRQPIISEPRQAIART